jgi:hypothetical protein
MKIREIEYQLRTYLPLYTDYFVDWLSVSSYSVNALEATIETATAHNLNVGEILNIRNVIFPNPITSLTQSAGIGTAILQENTDFTYPNTKKITISGANEAEYNGTFNILSIPDRKKIIFEIPFTAPASATGSPVSEESNLIRYNGLFSISSVLTPTRFVVDVSGPDFTALAGVEYFNMKDVRIAGDISAERMLDSYTKQPIDKWWMYIISSGSNVSKSKNITTDFDASHSSGDYYRQQTQEAFGVYVVIPTKNVITPVDAQDICTNELKSGLINSICGYFPVTLFTNSYEGIFYQADGIHTYNTAYYVHEYQFSTTVTIAGPDIFVPGSIAVNQIEFNHIDETYDIKSTDTINLNN